MTRKELINLKDAVLRRESLFYDLRESFKELESVTTDKREKALLSKAYETIAEIKEFYWREYNDLGRKLMHRIEE